MIIKSEITMSKLATPIAKSGRNIRLCLLRMSTIPNSINTLSL